MITVQAAWCLWSIPGESYGVGLAVFGAWALLKVGADFTSRRFYGS
jgi:hypothetical protein